MALEGIQPSKELETEYKANASKVPIAAQQMMIQCHSALYWGGSWSLVSENDADYEACKELVNELSTYGNGVRAWDVRGGLLLTAPPEWLIGVMMTLAPNFFSSHCEDFKARATGVANEEGQLFLNYWQKAVAGGNDCFSAVTKDNVRRMTGTIGVYCTNSVNTIAVNGITYPAFKLTADQLLIIMAQQPDAEYIVVNDVVNKRWIPLNQLVHGNQVNPAVVNCISFPIDSEGEPVNRPNALLMRFAMNDMKQFKQYWLQTQNGQTDCFNAQTAQGQPRTPGVIGIYCPNNQHVMQVGNVAYPAFKLTAEQLVQTMVKLPAAERIGVVSEDKQHTVALTQLVKDGQLSSTIAQFVCRGKNLGNAPAGSMYMQFVVK